MFAKQNWRVVCSATAVITLLAVITIGVVFASDPPKQKEVKVDESKVWAGIGVKQPIIFLKAGEQVPIMVFFGFVNDGDNPITPQLELTKLFINGKEWEDWPFTVSNGPKDNRWKSLRPGADLSFGYDLGNLFQEPGVYKLTWKGEGFQPAEVQFRVMRPS